jgi:hypothetical protein
LALRLGYVNVSGMLRSISSEQFLEWMQYDTIEPFGEWRDDWRSAEIVTMIANVNRDSKKKREPYRTTDFLVKFGEQEVEKKKAQTWQDQKMIAAMFVGAFNAE